MTDGAGENGAMPWYAGGLQHIWLPYAQMKTALLPLPVVRTQGTRIILADGRELIDGIASWWTACHGYNHPHIRQAVEAQIASMPHIMFGGLVHEQGLMLAKRLTSFGKYLLFLSSPLAKLWFQSLTWNSRTRKLRRK